jgi:type I restriction enzyme, S subunit
VSELQSFIADCTPKGWKVRPFWSLFRRKKETGFPHEELLSVYREYGVIPKSSRDDNHNKESEDLSAYQLVDEGCLVTNKMKAWQGSIAISRYRGIVSPAYFVYRPLSQEHDQFLHYLLRSDPYIALYGRISKGIRVNQWDLEHEALRNVPVMLPDLATQQAIAGFLDRETARIDQLIEKKQRMVELLGDKMAALIEALVTGRNRSDFQSDAGRSSFVKGMPQGWIEARVRFGISKIEQGWSPQCEDRLISNDEWGVLKLGAITTGVFREEAYKALPSDLAPRPEYAVRPGDVLIARASGSPAMVGKACYVDAISRNLMISDKHYRIYLSNARFMPEFFVYLINSRQSRAQIEVRLSSAEGMARNIGQDVIKNVWCAVPGYPEQLEIVRQMNFERSVYATLTSTTRSIDRLMEFRAALITAAVTGQIDVATWGKRGETDRGLDDIESNMAAAAQPERQQARA